MSVTWRHRKSGQHYVITGYCMIEATNTYAVLYVSTGGDSTVWCRPVDEFLDGRFEPLPGPEVRDETPKVSDQD